MAKFVTGAIIVATSHQIGPMGEKIITKGNLYHAGYEYGGTATEPSIWVVADDGVNRVFPESAFKRANIKL